MPPRHRSFRALVPAGLALAALLPSSYGHAQTPESDPAPCRQSAEARQLDFWIGHWAVHHPETGERLGENVVEPLLKGCVLLENWTGARGSSGKSMNFYDPQRRTWRQVWVSDRGNVLDYRVGELRDGAMRFRGITIDEDGDTTRQKLTFIAVAPDTVRQVMEASTDGGATWDTTWVGVYVRKPADPDEDTSAGTR